MAGTFVISVSDRASAAHLDSILKVTLSNLRSRYRTRKSPAFNDPRSICWRLIQLLIYGKVRAFEDQTCSMPPDLTSNPLPSTDGLLHKLNWAASFYAIKKIIAEGEPTTGLSAPCLPAIVTVLLDVQACMGPESKIYVSPIDDAVRLLFGRKEDARDVGKTQGRRRRSQEQGHEKPA